MSGPVDPQGGGSGRGRAAGVAGAAAARPRPAGRRSALPPSLVAERGRAPSGRSLARAARGSVVSILLAPWLGLLALWLRLLALQLGLLALRFLALRLGLDTPRMRLFLTRGLGLDTPRLRRFLALGLGLYAPRLGLLLALLLARRGFLALLATLRLIHRGHSIAGVGCSPLVALPGTRMNTAAYRLK